MPKSKKLQYLVSTDDLLRAAPFAERAQPDEAFDSGEEIFSFN